MTATAKKTIKDYTNKDNLPFMLKISEVTAILRMRKQDGYDLLKKPGFPFIRISEKRIRVPRDAFFKWLEDQGKGGNQ